VEPHFIGVDIAGAEKTWAAGLMPSSRGLQISFGPKLATPEHLMAIVNAQGATAVAIDGQLSLAFSDANGFRSSDTELRTLLPPDCRTWVASANSLMAVPVRARLLADAISPAVGTVLETHPRACLALYLGEQSLADVREYKRSTEAVQRLLDRWVVEFGIHGGVAASTDGALDAIVCATVAFCYHSAPRRLRLLRHSAQDRQGRGPFVVLDARATGA
jgi:predicted nuclease with RNAse H fold